MVWKNETILWSTMMSEIVDYRIAGSILLKKTAKCSLFLYNENKLQEKWQNL